MTSRLRRAVRRNELIVDYQPQAEMTTGAITGFEALVRWQRPGHGRLTPGAFLPIVSGSEVMKSITLYVLTRGLVELTQWRAEGHHVRLAVNVESPSLVDPRLPEQVSRRLADAGVPADALKLEITEEAVMTDLPRALDVLVRLRALGVQIALDDFGIGYSSMGRLKELPVNEIKIDRAFVENVATDVEDQAIVRAITDLGRGMGLRVVAEGVSSPEAWATLNGLGCNRAQGFFLARPLPSHDVLPWLGDRPTTSDEGPRSDPRRSSRPHPTLGEPLVGS
jgi:EAL domain-containing protein (putative c-di-GMP-specific phosphodiesterase class I)